MTDPVEEPRDTDDREIVTGWGRNPRSMSHVVRPAHADDLATILVGTRSPAHLRRSVGLMEAPPLPDAVLDACLALLERSQIPTLDITGGAVAAALAVAVMVRVDGRTTLVVVLPVLVALWLGRWVGPHLRGLRRRRGRRRTQLAVETREPMLQRLLARVAERELIRIGAGLSASAAN